MKKRNALLLLLLAIMTLSLILSSCESGKEDITTEEETTAVEAFKLDLDGYKIIRPETVTTTSLKKIVSLRLNLNEAINKDLEIADDWVKGGITEEADSWKEILVGQTNRSQSSEYLAKVEDSTSFVIAITDTKVIINSASDDGLASAIDYFLTLINSDGLLEVPEQNFVYISEPLPGLDVIKDGKSEFKIVYKDGLDTTYSNETDSKDKCDYEVDYCKELRKTIDAACGVSIDLNTDWYRKDLDKSALYEILIGDCDRDETREFLNSIAFDEYGYAVIGNKVVVAGWNLTTLKLACEAFETYITGAVSKDEEGKGQLKLLSTLKYVEKADGYYADFPTFEYGTIEGCMDSGYGDMEIMYNECTEDNFKDYCKKLESNGFTCWQTNDLDGNLSATYTGKEGMIHVYYVPTEKAVRIITCPDGSYNLPDCKDKTEVAAYTKITETKITQYAMNYSAGNFGNAYIITLEDGSFIVFDGGGYNDSYGDCAKLYQTLKKLNQRSDGVIHIAAWILTHEHWDHASNFLTMCASYGSNIEIEACYMNTPCEAETYNVNNPNYYIKSKFINLCANVKGGTKMVRVHTGMHFAIRNVEFDILYTEEDIYPDRNNYFNETSVIYRMEAAGQVIMWTGDNKNWGSNTCTSRYKTVIKADICQVSHHGYDGSTVAFYQAVNAKTLLWPTSESNVKGFESSSSSSGYIAVDKYLIQKYGYANIIIAEPTKTITLPYNNGDTIETVVLN